MITPVIDAHVHLIDPTRLDYPWLEGALDRAHTPADYQALHAEPPGVIVVEAAVASGRARDEVGWIRCEAAEHLWIRGIVNLQDEAAGFISSPELADGVRLLDHLGRPSLTSAAHEAWRRDIRALASLPDVVCKLSGLSAEAAPESTREQLTAALADVLQVFGPERRLYGSDRPVLNLATTYDSWMALVRDAVERVDSHALPAVLHGTAERIYRPAALTAA